MFKLVNNSVFGKTMKHVANRMEVKLTTDNAKAITWFSKLKFKDLRFNNGFHMLEMYKQEIVYDSIFMYARLYFI